MLTGSDSAPAKANEAKQANDVGAMKDEISLVAQNAQMNAYNDVYVDNNSTVTRGQASTVVGQKVIDEILKHFGGTARGSSEEKITREYPKGNVTVKIEQEFEGDAKITVSTTDVEKEGTVSYNGGALIWGEVSSSGGGSTYTAYSIGQEVTVGTGANAQEFYVLEASDSSQDTVTLLAKYNLSNTATNGHYMQAPDASYEDTNCEFSSTNYWATAWNTWNSGSKETMLNLNNEPIPTTGANAETVATNVILKARDYAKVVSGDNNNNTGRLLTYEEAIDGATYNDSEDFWEFTDSKKAEMIWGTSDYWLGSASEINNSVWYVYVNGDTLGSTIYYGYDDNTIGVRPVITISKSLVK